MKMVSSQEYSVESESMKILKKKDESIKLRIGNADDLWVLSKLCRPKRMLGMYGERRDQTTAGLEGGRAKSAERKKMWIVLDVESVEFQTFSDVLRVHGIIHEARIDKGSHHTHLVKEHMDVEIFCEGGLPSEDQQLLNEALKSSSKGNVAIAVVESDEVILYEVSSHGLREVALFSLRGGGKYEGRTNSSENARTDFITKVTAEINMQIPQKTPVVVCGPGMTREDFKRKLQALGNERTLVSVGTSMGGRSAANEVLREGLAKEILDNHALVNEIQILEDAFAKMAKGRGVAYGEKVMLMAKKQGAIDKVLILADLLRNEKKKIGDMTWADYCKKVKNEGSEIVQCSAEHDSGKQLEGLGGAIAILRFEI